MTWEPLARESTAATQKELEHLLGLTRETFRASSLMAQGDGSAFTRAPPRDRRRVLAEMLRLEVWEQLLDRVRSDLRAAELELARLRGLSDAAEAELVVLPAVAEQEAQLRERLAGLLKQAQAAELARDETRDLLAHTTGLFAEAQRASAERELAEERLAQLERIKRDAAVAEEKVWELDDHLAELDGLAADQKVAMQELKLLEERQKESEKRHAEHDRFLEGAARALLDAEKLTRELAHARLRIEELRAYEDKLARDPDTTCDRCGQALHDHARASAIASVRAEANAAEAESKLMQTARAGLIEDGSNLDWQAATIHFPPEPTPDEDRAIRRRLEDARSAEVEARATRLRIDILLKTAAAGTDSVFREQLAAARAAVERTVIASDLAERAAPSQDGIRTLEEKADVAERSLRQARSEADECQVQLVRASAQHERLLAVADAQAEAQGRIDDTARRISILKICERLYGANGIPALLIEAFAVPAIEADATRLLSELGLDFRVELRTQRELKRGGLAEALDIIVQTQTGPRPFEALCGSEQERVNIALRIALSRLLAHRRGADVQLLAIDEPAGLDERNAMRFARMLRGLEQDFERILLVSHLPALREAFEQVITIERDGEWSRIMDSSGGRADSDPAGEGPRSPTPPGRVPDAQGPGMGARTPAPTLFTATKTKTKWL